MGWILTIFDLPVGSKEERQAATKFRNWLLDDGYLMIQYSVYARPCVSYEHIEKHSERIMASTPVTGFVKIMFFTDKQWELSINIIGRDEYIAGRDPHPEIPAQILFW